MRDAVLVQKLVNEAEQMREQIEAWRAWAARLLAECGYRGSNSIGSQTTRHVIADLAKAGAEARARS